MANIKVEFFSNSLLRPVAFEMCIPNDFCADILREHNPHYDRNCKTVFVLHGYKGWGKGWDHLYTAAEKYNLALVFPSAENRYFHQFLLNNNVNVEYIESSGGHDVSFWNEYFAKGFEWMIGS